jgi:hypothetical protein
MILDAPGLLDDFYLNLVAWSVTNILAVALFDEVYLWRESDKSVTLLVTLSSSAKDYWSSMSWMEDVRTHNYLFYQCHSLYREFILRWEQAVENCKFGIRLFRDA